MHPTPDRALSDGAQSLYPEQLNDLIVELRAIATAIGRAITKPRPAGTAPASVG
jgi:3-deoxy-7-phosphoheptulonate synthase